MKRLQRILFLTLVSLLSIMWSMNIVQYYIEQSAWSNFLDMSHNLVYLDGKPIPRELRDRAGTYEPHHPSEIVRSFFNARPLRELFSPTHAQIGLVSIQLNISTQGCTQLLAGTTTTKIFVNYGFLSIGAQGTGQTLTFAPGLTNGTGTTCGAGALVNVTTNATGVITVTETGTTATASTIISIPQGAPAMVLPTSAALDVTTATATSVTGWLTVAQQ